MNGVKYYRLKRGIKSITLAQKTGISIGTIKNMERATKPGKISAVNYCKVADVLQVSIDDLLKNNYPDPGVEVPYRAPYPSRTANVKNLIYIYRRTYNITCQQLAHILGLKSRERARQLCSTKTPSEKHIKTLAAHEGISIDEFKNKYSFRGD
jgi:transcriptional regulator with XRE-family HTH domain